MRPSACGTGTRNDGCVPRTSRSRRSSVGRWSTSSDGELADYLAEATVLVTGAGGSIGAELCARLTRLGVRELVLVDQAEAPLLELAAALRYEHGFTDAVPVLADIRSAPRTARGVRAASPARGLSHRRVQAGASARGASGRGRRHERPRDEMRRGCRPSCGCRALRPVLHGQGGAADEHPRADEGGRRVDRRGRARDAAATRRFASETWSTRRGASCRSSGGRSTRGGPVTITHPETTRYLMTGGRSRRARDRRRRACRLERRLLAGPGPAGARPGPRPATR